MTAGDGTSPVKIQLGANASLNAKDSGAIVLKNAEVVYRQPPAAPVPEEDSSRAAYITGFVILVAVLAGYLAGRRIAMVRGK